MDGDDDGSSSPDPDQPAGKDEASESEAEEFHKEDPPVEAKPTPKTSPVATGEPEQEASFDPETLPSVQKKASMKKPHNPILAGRVR